MEEAGPAGHVSESSSCVNFGVLRIGDNVEVAAVYNVTAHNQNLNMMHEGGGILSMLGIDPKPNKYA